MNQVIKKEKSDIALASMFEKDSHASFDNMGSGDFALPFLRALMNSSPEVDEMNAKYIKGAKAGMILNTGTKELINGAQGVNIIPCYYKREYVEWSDRGQGTAAPIAIHPVGSDIVATTKKDALFKERLPNGNYLEETASYFVMQEEGGAALVTMKSTGLPIARGWNTMMNSIKLPGSKGMFTPAMYSHLYKLKTVQQSNDKGTWYNWSVEKVGPVQDKGLYEQAKSFAVSANKGDVTAKHGEEDTKSKQDSVPF